MKNNIEIIDLKFDDLIRDDNVEIVEIDNIDVEIIEIDDDVSFNEVLSDSLLKENFKESFLFKVRKKLSSRKIAVVIVSCVSFVITLNGVFYLNNKISKNNEIVENNNIVYMDYHDDVTFSLNDEEYNTINLNDEYVEKGANIIIDGVDYSSEIIIDSSNLNVNEVGTYYITYSYPFSKNSIKTIYRTINVVDNEAPNMVLLGSNIHTMLVNDEYVESGVLVSDNSNESLIDNIIVESNVDNTVVGEYFIKYSVSDSSGNNSFITRKVIVKDSYYSNSNTVLSNYFTNTGINLTGCVLDDSFKYQMLVKNKTNGEEFIVNLEKTSNHYYNFTLNVLNLKNGVYEFYLVNDSLELLSNNMNSYNKIVRAHIGDKLITMDYSKNNVVMNVEDFEYLYDVVIDPGHGGSEKGAFNGKYIEKNINLEQSLYEKKRYEEHGLRVLLLREDDSYGIVMGDERLDSIDRKAFAVGYYGSVSKIIYSNHHNSSLNKTSAGWEILVPSYASFQDLKVEHSIADAWSSLYIEPTNPYYRFYTKDFETATPNNKINGEIYNFDDYYSVIRVPYKLFKVKNVLFEGAYINNSNDMYWYYDKENWKMLSEVKIKFYVESLGLKYIEP